MVVDWTVEHMESINKFYPDCSTDWLSIDRPELPLNGIVIIGYLSANMNCTGFQCPSLLTIRHPSRGTGGRRIFNAQLSVCSHSAPPTHRIIRLSMHFVSPTNDNNNTHSGNLNIIYIGALHKIIASNFQR